LNDGSVAQHEGEIEMTVALCVVKIPESCLSRGQNVIAKLVEFIRWTVSRGDVYLDDVVVCIVDDRNMPCLALPSVQRQGECAAQYAPDAPTTCRHPRMLKTERSFAMRPFHAQSEPYGGRQARSRFPAHAKTNDKSTGEDTFA
jgi:hypothetical protein